MIYVTVTLRHPTSCFPASLYVLLLFGFFNETAMLIEWLEKNRSRERELVGFTALFPKGTHTVPVSSEPRLRVNHNAKDVNFN